ncbi:MAG: laccase domain-containing protein, partial [Phycisphaerales bacterium]|nr:laccase domain-containing protein [Phycisphaerales bacterium]
MGRGGREIVQVHQVHGAEVLTVRGGGPSHARAGDTKADAIVSDDPARVLCVRVADCAPVLLAEQGALDYLTLEYLAELTMSILALQRQRDPQAGFASDFLDVLPRLAPALRQQP